MYLHCHFISESEQYTDHFNEDFIFLQQTNSMIAETLIEGIYWYNLNSFQCQNFMKLDWIEAYSWDSINVSLTLTN